MKVLLKNVRLSFPNLWKASSFGGEGKPAFSASFIFGDEHEVIELMNEAIDTVATEKWGVKAKAILGSLVAQNKTCLHSGDTKPDMDGYAGNYFVSARAYQKPLVIDRGKQPLAETDGRPYAGCYVNASVEVWAQDNEFGRRINATLRGVQFLNDGDAFAGGAPATPDEFEDEGADESALA